MSRVSLLTPGYEIASRSLRKEQRVAVIARLGSYDSTHFEIYDGRLVGVAPIPWWQELGLPAPARYKVVRVEDYSIAGRSRNSIRVIILDEWASWPEVHSALLEAARTHPADGVLVFGHRPGDDTDTFYTAGRLEWGRTGYGWTGDEYLGPAGEFDAGGAIPPEAQEFLRSMAEP